MKLKGRMKSFRKTKSVRQGIIDFDYRKDLNADVTTLMSGAIADTNKCYNSVENEMPKSQYLPVSKLAHIKATYNDATKQRIEGEDHHRRQTHNPGVVRRHSSLPDRSASQGADRAGTSSRRRRSKTYKPRRNEPASSPVPIKIDLEPREQRANIPET